MSRIRSELNLLNLIPTSEWLGYWRAHQSCVCIKDKTGNLKGQWLMRIAEILGFWSSNGFSHSTMAVQAFGRQEQAEWVQGGIHRPWFHSASCWLKHQVIWDWRLCLLRSRRAISRATDYLYQRQESHIPPRWVGSELMLSEVNNRVFRPLCFSVPYSQTFSVKTV